MSHAAICAVPGSYQITSAIPSALTSPAVAAIHPAPGPGISSPAARTFVPSISLDSEKRSALRVGPRARRPSRRR